MSHDPLACAARPGLSAGPPPLPYAVLSSTLLTLLTVTRYGLDSYLYLSSSSKRREAGRPRGRGGTWLTGDGIHVMLKYSTTTRGLWHWVTSATTPHTHTRRLTRERQWQCHGGKEDEQSNVAGVRGAVPRQGQSTEAVAPARMSSRLPTE